MTDSIKMTRFLDGIGASDIERILDDTSVPLSDDEMEAMSAYFDAESFQHEDYLKDN